MSNLFDEAIKGISVRFEDKNKKIAELEAKIKNLEQAQPKWISVEQFELIHFHSRCWIVYKSAVNLSTYVDGKYCFIGDSSACYLRECISAVMPIVKPQPPEVK